MKSKFIGYYTPTDDEFSDLWDNCIFSFDANALLNIFRYSRNLQDELLDTIDALQARTWVSHQAAMEFHERRLDVVADQVSAYDHAVEGLGETKKFLRNRLSNLAKHAFLDGDEILAPVNKVIDSRIRSIRRSKDVHASKAKDDANFARLSQLLEGRVGDPYIGEARDAKLAEAEARFGRQEPPGYKDNKKPGDRKFGDAMIWFQLMDYAASQSKPIIFVTDDLKDDWWRERKGQTIAPRAELIQEMKDFAGVSFWMYPTWRFIEMTQHQLGRQTDDAAVAEARKVSQSQRALVTAARRAAYSGLSAQRAIEAITDPALLRALRAVNGSVAQQAIEAINNTAVQRALRALDEGVYSEGIGFERVDDSNNPDDTPPDEE